MKFLIVAGCDNDDAGHSLGRYRVELIDAASMEEAVEKVSYPEGRNEYCAFDPDLDYCLDEVWIIPAEHVTALDCKALQEAARSARKSADREKAEAAERAELDRLLKKYGKPHGEETEWTGEPHPEVGKL